MVTTNPVGIGLELELGNEDSHRRTVCLYIILASILSSVSLSGECLSGLSVFLSVLASRSINLEDEKSLLAGSRWRRFPWTSAGDDDADRHGQTSGEAVSMER